MNSKFKCFNQCLFIFLIRCTCRSQQTYRVTLHEYHNILNYSQTSIILNHTEFICYVQNSLWEIPFASLRKVVTWKLISYLEYKLCRDSLCRGSTVVCLLMLVHLQRFTLNTCSGGVSLSAIKYSKPSHSIPVHPNPSPRISTYSIRSYNILLQDVHSSTFILPHSLHELKSIGYYTQTTE